jgi:membrane-associated phospholipid phosphatase
MKLPRFIRPENKAFVCAAAAAAVMGLYVASNHDPIFTPRPLPYLWIDGVVPFLPWTSWIYVSAFALIPIAFFNARTQLAAHRLFYSFLALGAISTLFFVLLPTSYPRYRFPLPEGLSLAQSLPLVIIRTFDRVINCAPSLHVSGTVLACLALVSAKNKRVAIYVIWTLIVALSTMTTKQHYFVDVVAGALLAAAVHRFVFLRISLKKSDS